MVGCIVAKVSSALYPVRPSAVILLVAIGVGSSSVSAADSEVNRLVDEARVLFRKGDYARAEEVVRQAEAATRRGLSHDDISVVYVDMLFGQILQARGDYQGAKESFEHGLAWIRKAYGPEHPSVSGPLKNLANVFVLLGDFPLAEQAAREAVDVNSRHPEVGPKHPQTASAMHSLAAVMSAKGDFAAAEQLLKTAIEIKEEAERNSDQESLDATISLQDLAGLYYERGEYARAEPLRKQIIAKFEKLAGPEHPDTAGAINNTARLYRAMGLYERAEPLQRRAGEILERAFPPEHPRVAHAASNLGGVAVERGQARRGS